MIPISYRANGSTSNIERVFLYKDSGAAAGTEGDPMTGLTNASTGLSISVIADVTAAPTVDTSAATSSIQGITTLGTYETPTAGFVRFKEVASTSMPGLYELQWEDSVYSVSNAKYIDICITGVADLATFTGRVYLDVMNESGLRSALGLATNNLDAQLATIDTVVDGIAADYATSADTASVNEKLDDIIDGTTPARADVVKWLTVTPDALLTAADVGLLYSSTIATLVGPTQYNMTLAISTNNINAGNVVTLVDAGNPVNTWTTWVMSVDQSLNQIVVKSNAPWFAAVGDYVRIHSFVHSQYHASESIAGATLVTNDFALALAQLLARKDSAIATDRATELGLINQNEGTGVGGFTPVTDSQEATADKLPAALSNGTIDANIVRVTDVAITGTGTSIDPWNP
jgi:hypothetical protein